MYQHAYIKAVIERQQRIPAKGNDNGLLLDGEHRRSRLFRAGRKVRYRGPIPPLGNGLLIDSVTLRKRPARRTASVVVALP